MFYIFLFKNKENIFVFFVVLFLSAYCYWKNAEFLSVGTPFPIVEGRGEAIPSFADTPQQAGGRYIR